MLRSSNKGFLKNIITNRHTAADIGVSNLLSQEKEEEETKPAEIAEEGTEQDDTQ